MDVEQYIRNLPWSERATDHEKALVEGNLRGFYAEMQKATQPLFDAAVAIELQIDEQTLAERDTRPPPPEPKIMGEEVEEKQTLEDAWCRNRAKPAANDEELLRWFTWWERHRDDYAKDTDATYVAKEFASTIGSLFATIESLRASLTRVEEERDARPTIEEWSNEIDRVRDHWKAKLATVEKERDGMGGALVIAAERLRVAASRVDRADTEFGFRQWAEEAERASGLSRASGETEKRG